MNDRFDLVVKCVKAQLTHLF